jgi:pyruvate formate lyase activating enzyme
VNTILNIHSIETFGTHEGPGIRLVIFLQGCNFRCLYCHNPDTQTINGGKEISTEEIVKKAVDQKPYFGNNGGVTISGGEPLLQSNELFQLFQQLKKHKIHTAIDTNGSLLNNDVKKLLDITDLVLLDVKHIDGNWHKKLTGASNKAVLEFARYRESTEKPMWLRYVLVPGYSDQPEHIEKWAMYFPTFKYIERFEILPYHTFGVYKYKGLGMDYKLDKIEPPTQENIQKVKEAFEKYLYNVYIR